MEEVSSSARVDEQLDIKDGRLSSLHQSTRLRYGEPGRRERAVAWLLYERVVERALHTQTHTHRHNNTCTTKTVDRYVD